MGFRTLSLLLSCWALDVTCLTSFLQKSKPASPVKLEDEFGPHGYMDIARTGIGSIGHLRELMRDMSQSEPITCGSDPSCPLASFNPSVLQVPNGASGLPKGTKYAVTLRHMKDLCSSFLRNDSEIQRYSRDAFDPGESVALLNRHLKPLAVAPVLKSSGPTGNISFLNNPIRFPSFRPFEYYDGRLFPGRVPGEILMTYVLGQGTHLQPLRLRMNSSGKLEATLLEDTHVYIGGRNVGLIRNGSNFHGMMWAGLPSMRMSKRLPMEAPSKQPSEELRSGHLPRMLAIDDGVDIGLNSDDFHNNVNPMWLPEENAYLGVMHRHLEYRTVARWGSHYVHYLMLFDVNGGMQRPTMQRVSPAFCIPSRNDPDKCEVIQFVSSIVRIGDDVLIAYGKNDCTAASVKVPVKSLLKFLYSGYSGPNAVKEAQQEPPMKENEGLAEEAPRLVQRSQPAKNNL